MTADDIRNQKIRVDWTNEYMNVADSIFHMLREIAAQLAELNDAINKLPKQRNLHPW